MQILEQSKFLHHKDAILKIHKYIDRYISKQDASNVEKERWKVLNKNLKNIFLSPEFIHLLKHCTGSGKTTNTMLWSKMLSLVSPDIDGFVVLSTEYENGTYDIKNTMNQHGEKIKFVLFEGKNRLCLCKNIKLGSSDITLGELMKYGIPINRYCKEECDVCDDCVYKKNCNELLKKKEEGGIKTWIGVSHQLNNFLPLFLQKSKNIILILDEEFSDSIKVSDKYRFKELKDNKEFLELLIETNKNTENKDYVEFLKHLLTFIQLLLHSLHRETDKYELDYEEIENVLFDLSIYDIDFSKLTKQIDDNLFELIKEDKIKPFKCIHRRICNYIENYYAEQNKYEHDMDHINEWIKMSFYKKRDKFYISFLYYDKVSLSRIFANEKISKIIIADATGNESLYESIYDTIPIITHNEDWIYDNSIIHQLKKVFTSKGRKYAQYPKSSISNYKSTFLKMSNIIKQISKVHKNDKILVVSRDILPKDFSFGHPIKLSSHIKYINSNISFEDYPLKGTNKYKDYNVCIILGTPDLPNLVIKRQSILLGINEKDYRIMYSVNLIKQAMGRIMRGNEKKYFYIITGVDVGIPIKRTYKSFSNFIESIDTTKFNLIKEYIKVNKYITVKEALKLFRKSEKIGRTILSNFIDMGILHSKRIGKAHKLIYFL